ncbi:hypothetical protein GGD63_006323 [Bradyrhizobium sp. cir1]|nr:hypothetical protein [Bradyrhizobium sp. cir1]
MPSKEKIALDSHAERRTDGHHLCQTERPPFGFTQISQAEQCVAVGIELGRKPDSRTEWIENLTTDTWSVSGSPPLASKRSRISGSGGSCRPPVHAALGLVVSWQEAENPGRLTRLGGGADNGAIVLAQHLEVGARNVVIAGPSARLVLSAEERAYLEEQVRCRSANEQQ